MAWFYGALVDGHILHGTMVNQYDRAVLKLIIMLYIQLGISSFTPC